jgi:hypothetical protein
MAACCAAAAASCRACSAANAAGSGECASDDDEPCLGGGVLAAFLDSRLSLLSAVTVITFSRVRRLRRNCVTHSVAIIPSIVSALVSSERSFAIEHVQVNQMHSSHAPAPASVRVAPYTSAARP